MKLTAQHAKAIAMQQNEAALEYANKIADKSLDKILDKVLNKINYTASLGYFDTSVHFERLIEEQYINKELLLILRDKLTESLKILAYTVTFNDNDLEYIKVEWK